MLVKSTPGWLLCHVNPTKLINTPTPLISHVTVRVCIVLCGTSTRSWYTCGKTN